MNESTEYIRIGKGPLQPIKVRPITLIFPAANLNERISYDERLEIDCRKTVEHVDSIIAFHDETEALFRIVFKDYEGEFTPAEIRLRGMGMKHVAGLIDMSLDYMDKEWKFVWKYPESFLHPTSQLELAEVLVALTQRV